MLTCMQVAVVQADFFVVKQDAALLRVYRLAKRAARIHIYVQLHSVADAARMEWDAVSRLVMQQVSRLLLYLKRLLRRTPARIL